MDKATRGHNKVYIATSLDGFIADTNGGIAFLDTYPIPEDADMGYEAFMGQIDALLMGRITFETVLGFGVAWPYTKPVFVWSNTLKNVPKDLETKVELVKGDVLEVLRTIHERGLTELYLDGGKVIQSFLKKDLIDEMIITTIPVLLGKGIPLFGETNQLLKFRCVQTRLFPNGLCQHVYSRVRG